MRRPLAAVTNIGSSKDKATTRGRRHCTDERSDDQRRRGAKDSPAAPTRRDDVRRRCEESRRERGRGATANDARGRGTARPAGQPPTRPSNQVTTSPNLARPSAFEYFSRQCYGEVHDQLPLMLCDGSFAGGAPPLWRPTNNASPWSDQPSCLEDGGIRRRTQVTYRELCADWSIQYRAINSNAHYLTLRCPRCSRKALTAHTHQCFDPVMDTGIFCPFCHATLFERNEFGQHCVQCWAFIGSHTTYR